MMLVGFIHSKKQAQLFARYLQSQEMSNRVEQHDGQYEIWVVSEEHVDEAKELLEHFRQHSSDIKYKVRVKKSGDSDDKKLKAHYRKVFKRPQGHQITITLLVCMLLFFILLISPFRLMVIRLLAITGSVPVSFLLSQPWRIVTPVFLNMGLLAFLFNAYWFYDLGCFVEAKQSRLFYMLLLFIATIASNFAQLLFSGGFFGGVSPLVFALFGFIWSSSVWNPWSGYYIRQEIVYLMFAWLVLSFFHWLGPGHDVGNVAGLFVGVLFTWFKAFKKHKK